MSQINIQIEGLAELKNKFSSSPERIGKAIHEGLDYATQELAREAKRALTFGATRAIKTGQLRASVGGAVRGGVGGGSYKGGSYPEGTGISIEKFSATITPVAKHAIFVHEGTKYMKPRPFLIVAVNEAKGRITEKFAKLIEGTL